MLDALVNVATAHARLIGGLAAGGLWLATNAGAVRSWARQRLAAWRTPAPSPSPSPAPAEDRTTKFTRILAAVRELQVEALAWPAAQRDETLAGCDAFRALVYRLAATKPEGGPVAPQEGAP